MRLTEYTQSSMSVNKLETWLREAYASDVLMPCAGSSKHPLFRHVEHSWGWSDWQKWKREHKTEIKQYNIAILLRQICVVDVDDKDTADQLERMFPVLQTVARAATTRGFHYYFQRSPLCDADGYYTQHGVVVPKIDFKSVCSTGTASVILVQPSEGKTWIAKPWKSETLTSIPDDLLKTIAIPMSKIQFVFRDGSQLTVPITSILKQFDLLEHFITENEPTVPLMIGCAQDMQILLQLCTGQQFQWPFNVNSIKQFARYLCSSDKVLEMVDETNPKHRLSWMFQYHKQFPKWLQDMSITELVDLTNLQIFYSPPLKSRQWLFPVSNCIELCEGEAMLRENLMDYAVKTVPLQVRQILTMFPDSICLAGGAALELVCPHTLVEPRDYDLFVIGDTSEGIKIWQAVCKLLPNATATQTGNAYTWFIEPEHQQIQLILKTFKSVEDVLQSFDIAACQVVLHRNRFWATQNFCYSIQHMSVVLDFSKWTQSTVSRAFKYYSKGFEIFIPGTMRERFKQNWTTQTVSGILNIFRIEWAVVPVPTVNRPDAQLLRNTVSLYNYWGDRNCDGGYECRTKSGFFHVVQTMIRNGYSWIGKRINRNKKAPPNDIPQFSEANSRPFSLTPHNITTLY